MDMTESNNNESVRTATAATRRMNASLVSGTFLSCIQNATYLLSFAIAGRLASIPVALSLRDANVPTSGGFGTGNATLTRIPQTLSGIHFTAKVAVVEEGQAQCVGEQEGAIEERITCFAFRCYERHMEPEKDRGARDLHFVLIIMNEG